MGCLRLFKLIIPQEDVAQENHQKIETEKQIVQKAKSEFDKHQKVLEEAYSKYSSVRNKIDQLSEEIEPLKVNKKKFQKLYIFLLLQSNFFSFHMFFISTFANLKIVECVKYSDLHIS